MSIKSFSQQAGRGGALVAAFTAGLCVGIALDFNEAAAPDDGRLRGTAQVYDGDTITLLRGEEKLSIRIYAVDAPERRQSCGTAQGRVPCGNMARDAVITMIAEREVVCDKIVDRDRYGRYVAVCFTADGQDIGGTLIAQGLAYHYAAYSDGRYAAAEDEARNARRGLWGMDVMAPDEWRRCFTGPIVNRPATGCPPQP